MLILVLLLYHHSVKKSNSEKNAVKPIDFNSFEIVIILLAKTVVIQL